jgi:CO/xanthine dehydrogenase Mo-binding subunit
MAPGAPELHPGLPASLAAGKPNVCEHFRHELGDVAAGFAEADEIVEREFHTATVHQGYIEPHSATALWNNDGRVHIWCSTQGSFVVRDTTACVLGVPVSQVKVTPMEIGGGFGGKIPVYLEPVAAMLSRKAGRPVRIVMPRKDVFEGTGPTPGSYIKVKMGARRDGRITAAQAYMAYEAGAFPGSMVAAGALCVLRWSTSQARPPTALPARPTPPSPAKPWWTRSPNGSAWTRSSSASAMHRGKARAAWTAPGISASAASKCWRR